MFVPSVAIILIILLIAVVYARRVNARLAVGVIPLTIVPISYILSRPLAGLIGTMFTNTPRAVLQVLVLLTGLAICCMLLGFYTLSFKNKSTKQLYIAVLGGFSLALTFVYIRYLILPLIK